MTPRIIAALRELADAFAEEMGDDAPVVELRPRQKRDRRPRALTRPAGEADPHVAAQAAKILRDRGMSR